MIERYSMRTMARIWEDKFKLHCWIRIEFAALRAMMKEGLIPKFDLPDHMEHLDAVSQKLVEDWLNEEINTHHDVVAFVHVMEQKLGDNGKWFHYGMTSSDLCDTEFALRIQSALGLIKGAIVGLQNIIGEKAQIFKMQPIIGRTHGMHAEPTTFGLVLLTYVDELQRHLERLDEVSQRVEVGKISGAVGTYAHLSPDIERHALQALGLNGESVASQVVHRDRHAELFNLLALVGGTIERLAIEIRHLSRSEVKEVAEPFGKNQKGSSAMPHKKNPIKSENVTGLARMLRSYAGAAMENIALWHQRDISHSSVERMIAPDAFGLLFFMLNRMCDVVNGLVVDEDKMRYRVYESLPHWRTQTEMLKLIQKGYGRKEAHDMMQNNPITSSNQESLIEYHLRHVDTIFEKIR